MIEVAERNADTIDHSLENMFYEMRAKHLDTFVEESILDQHQDWCSSIESGLDQNLLIACRDLLRNEK